MRNLWKVVYMNVVLTFHLSFSLSIANLIPQISDQNGFDSLGQVSIITIYTVNLIFNLIASAYLSKMSYRAGFVLQGLLCVPVFLAATVITRCTPTSDDTLCSLLYPIDLIGCILMGAGLGGYFVLQNTYISDCSDENNKEILFGIAYMLLGAAFLMSGVLSEQLLNFIGRDDFFLYGGACEFVFALFFIFVQKPQAADKVEPLIQYESLQSQTDDNELLTNEKFSQLPIFTQIKTIFTQINEKMMHLMPMFIATGCIIGFEFGVFYKFVDASLPADMPKPEKNIKNANAFQYLGAGQVFGGLFNGVVNKLLGTCMNSIIYSNSILICIIIALLNSFMKEYYINLIFAFLLGFTDNSGQFSSAIMISEKYGDRISVYGFFLFCQNFGLVLVNVIVLFVDSFDLFYNLVLLLLIQMIVSLMLQKFQRKYEYQI